jgi:hypothetical protein
MSEYGTPVIFTHYGYTDYLDYTLSVCSAFNPQKKKIFIGDEQNYEVATRYGWHHFMLEEIRSDLRNQFNSWFRWVQGKNHTPIKGGKDWLRFVFERWFCIEELLRRLDVQRFWHFDSDTMIVKSLDEFEDEIEKLGVSCTTQCNDNCLNGWCNSEVIPFFCRDIISSFQDAEFIRSQQYEFENKNPEYAYTEMRAFTRFRDRYSLKTRHLECLFEDNALWFDDCLAQEDLFDFVFMEKFGIKAKAIYAENGRIYGRRKGACLEFASLNCSWLPIDVFVWIKSHVLTDANLDGGVPNTLEEYTRLSFGERIKRAPIFSEALRLGRGVGRRWSV